MVLLPRARDSPFTQLLIHVFLILACVVAVYPLVRILTLSLGPISKSFVDPFTVIPKDASPINYLKLFGDKDFVQWLLNSLAITVSVSLIAWRCLPRARMPFHVGSFLAVRRRWCSC